MSASTFIDTLKRPLRALGFGVARTTTQPDSDVPRLAAYFGTPTDVQPNGSLGLNEDGPPHARIGDTWKAVAVAGQTWDAGAAGIKADVIAESTTAAGVTVDGVLLKDGTVTTDTVSEATGGAGVTVDGTLIKDGGLTGAGTVLLTGSATGDGQVVQRWGATATEGLQVVVYEETLSPSAVETSVISIPPNSRILAVQSNVETALTGGGTTDSYGIGTTGDPDKYGSSATLTQNSKSDFLGDGTVISAPEDVVLTGTASETADGDTALTVGSVRVRIVYLRLTSLDDAA